MRGLGNSIDDWISRGDSATIWCHNSRCNHRGPLNLEALRRRLGGHHGMLLDEIRHVLKCSKCEGKKLGMTVHPRTPSDNPFSAGSKKR